MQSHKHIHAYTRTHRFLYAHTHTHIHTHTHTHRFGSFYGTDEEGAKCASFDIGVRSSIDVLRVVRRYYETDFARKMEAAPWDIRHNLPIIYDAGMNGTVRGCFSKGSDRRMNSTGEVAMNFWDVSWLDQSKWAPFLFHGFIDTVGYYAPWTQDAASCFFTFKTLETSSSSGSSNASDDDRWTMGNLLKDSLVCKFDNVMFCGKRSSGEGGDGDVSTRTRKNIFVCFVISFFIWYAAGVILSYVPGAGGLYVIVYSFMWVLVPVTTVYISYGVSIACFPMVPTCLVEDVVVILQDILPVQMRWPDALQMYPGCIQQVVAATNSSVEAAAACLKSCREDPFYFYTWEHSIAWIACSFDAVSCTSLDLPYAPLVREASWNFSSVHANAVAENAAGMDVWRAHQYCFFMTLAQAFPWILLGMVVAYTLASILFLPFLLLPATVQFIFQAVSFTHVD